VLEFFYPSTEWNMSQPFDCSCGAKVRQLSLTAIVIISDFSSLFRVSVQSCLKRISGAKHIPSKTLKTFVVNEHIKRLKAEGGDAL
jgi:hypothetical protein